MRFYNKKPLIKEDRWFAWYPVKIWVTHEIVWLEFVDRLIIKNFMITPDRVEYYALGEDV